MNLNESHLEITTSIGCKINCIKYCPQELITSRYKGNKYLTLENFKYLISTVPKEIPIIFAGVSEPFLNPHTIDMILYAHIQGHLIQVDSTLVGLCLIDAELISSTVPFQQFVIHLPDTHGNAHINITEEYCRTLGIILGGVHNLSFMNMGMMFESLHMEDIARGTSTVHKKGRVCCYRHEHPDYYMMPNGDVYFCCITRGLIEQVGSLYDNTYQELTEPEWFQKQSLRMQTDEQSICHKCSFSHKYQPPWLSNIKQKCMKILMEHI